MYNATKWLDKVVDVDSGEVIQAGTDQSAAHFNNMESGITDASVAAAMLLIAAGELHCSTHGLQKWIEKNIIFKRKEMADIELPQEVTQWELNQF